MQTNIFPLALALGLLAYPAFAGQTLTVEPNHSTIGFEIPISGGITRVTGKFTEFEITLDYPSADVLQWGIEATIQSASVDTGIDDRDDHLESATFFHSKKHPEIRFASRRIERQGDAYVAHGDLTMRGVTRPLALPFEITNIVKNDAAGVRQIGFAARGTLNRNDFGVGSDFKHTHVKNFLGEEVTLEIYCYLRAKPRPEPKTVR